MAAGLPLPKRVIAHGWWLTARPPAAAPATAGDGKAKGKGDAKPELEKISKSGGGSFSPVDKARQFGLDAIRFYLLRETSFEGDGEYSDERMLVRYTADLADNLGNLVLRATKNLSGGKIAAYDSSLLTEEDELLIHKVKALPGVFDHHLITLSSVHDGICAVWEILRELNLFLQHNEPWR
eukprot:223300_1